MTKFDRRSVLVTGGTVRIGKAISERLRAEGWKVITSSHRPDSDADIICDGTEEFAGRDLYSKAKGLAGGHLDAVVLNAGVISSDSFVCNAVNCSMPSEMISAAKENGGSVVVIQDIDAILRKDDPALPKSYYESKRRLEKLAQSYIGKSNAKFRINIVALGSVLPPEGIHQKARKSVVANPMPNDVAMAVAFLLDTPSLTGVTIPVDGGSRLT